ncbi:hypothetical protein, partial [Persephonella sp.]
MSVIFLSFLYQRVLIKQKLLFLTLLRKIKLKTKIQDSSLNPPALYKIYPPNPEKTSHQKAPIKAVISILCVTKGCSIEKTKEANAIFKNNFPNSSNTFF